MKILFVKPSDENNSNLGQEIDLHCNYDYDQWEIGFRAIGLNLTTYPFMTEFVETGSSKIHDDVLKIISSQDTDLIVIPAMHFEISRHHIVNWQKLGAKVLFVFFDDSFRYENFNCYYLRWRGCRGCRPVPAIVVQLA
jgi:hypothetical protein